MHRAHFAAGIRQELNRPVVVVCADEGEAERMARDLAALSGEEVRTLSAREFTFHNAAVVSRQYEHRRLSTLRALAAGECPLLVCTVESILQRTIPKTLLTQAAQVLRMGERHDLGELAGTLAAAATPAASRWRAWASSPCGGASWTFSPRPTPSPSGWSSSGTRSMPWASSIPDTQRRIENLGRGGDPAGGGGAAPVYPWRVRRAAGGAGPSHSQAKRRKGNETLVQTLEEDRERLAASTAFPAMDRYIA